MHCSLVPVWKAASFWNAHSSSWPPGTKLVWSHRGLEIRMLAYALEDPGSNPFSAVKLSGWAWPSHLLHRVARRRKIKMAQEAIYTTLSNFKLVRVKEQKLYYIKRLSNGAEIISMPVPGSHIRIQYIMFHNVCNLFSSPSPASLTSLAKPHCDSWHLRRESTYIR